VAWAVITLNRQSISQARKLKEHFDIDIYTIDKYMEEGLKPIIGGLKKHFGSIFNKYEAIIGIMAMGIIVRDITPYIKHKSIDPAVLCLSVDGRFIIPVLSGHLGGANDIAVRIGNKIGAIPVITTASDLLNKKAVDLIAKERGLTIASFKDAMEITSRMINNENIGIIYQNDVDSMDKTGLDGVVLISNRTEPRIKLPYAQLIPKNIVIGVGAKRDSDPETIKALVLRVLNSNNLNIKAVSKVASIDIKKDEVGIVELATYFKVPFITYSSERIKEVEDMFDSSEFVRKITGVGSVSMPSGYLASNRGDCLVKKVAESGITVSIWEDNSDLYS